MFKVGDKVVYPMHGAGIIESIEEKEVLGEKRSYYIMKIPIGDMKVMVPMDNVQDIGLRQVIDTQEMSEVIGILQDKNSTMNVSWNKRYRANMDKIKSGNIFEVAEVVRNLTIRDKDKGLSTGERKMLENAKRILISELVLVKNIAEDQVEDLLHKVLA
ncbi:CarD family transcriptional regulator [Desulfitibacter alkalitolerans]|uniref:CarD family transcriptional regulator n=1 Tax=Desulfitibacter alkalitolerans TaxID=264641 RepID=UPI0004879A8D|nr:CarD family transcriptional regulator [Desulfitibacter alkalitolerans]